MKTRITALVLGLLALSAGLWAGARKDSMVVISWEDGSGTRSAFIELFGVLSQGVDQTSPGAEITNSTGVMMASVSGDRNAVGYLSLGSLNETVKALKIGGVEPTAANVANGSYIISRPFLIALKGEPKAEARDFIGFIMSREGQDVIEKNGYIRITDSGPFSGAGVSGKIVLAGSSSVTPVMEKLKEAYGKINPGLDIEIQQSDSSTGMNAAIDRICDIGMASRELKDGEVQKGLQGMVIAMDGIAVIVHRQNPVSDLTKEQVRDIFTGKIVLWSSLAK